MPPRKIPLFCLIHGHTENSAFGIRYEKKMTFDELRDAIFEKNKNAFENDNLDPPDLILYKVDIDTTTQNSQRTALGNPEADIVNDLGGLLMKPLDRLEEEIPVIVDKHIYIIVKLSARATAESSSVILEESSKSRKRSIEERFTDTTQKFIDYVDRESKKPKLKVALSKISQSHLRLLLDHFKFSRGAVNITINSTKDFDQPFVWDQRNEDQHAEDTNDNQDQVVRGYMSYLRINIVIPGEFVWYNAKSKKELLNVEQNDLLPYSITGTTDVLVMDKLLHDCYDYRSGIRAGFELKKSIQDNDPNQAIAELVVANIVSNYAVFIVLTDLQSKWIFYWLANDKKVMSYPAKSSGDALAIIENALAQNSTTLDPDFHIGMRGNYFRDSQREESFVDEMDEHGESSGLSQLLNRPKVEFDFENDDDVANMEDVYEDMSDDEIKKSKIKRMLNKLNKTPGFELNEDYVSLYS